VERVRPVPEKIRLEMLVETQTKILDGQSSCLFSNEPFKKRPWMTIEDFGLHSNDHFESHLLGKGLLQQSVRSDIINGLRAGAVGGVGNPSLVSSMPPGVAPGPVDSASAPPSSGRGNYLPTKSQASYHSASSSPSARRPSSGFDGVNEEADVRANSAVVDGPADVRTSAVMTHVNDDDAEDGIFDDALCEILGASFRVARSLDLDLAFGVVDVNVDLACTSLLSPLSPLPPPIASPPPSAAAGESIRDPGVFIVIIVFPPYWWLSYNKLFSLSAMGRVESVATKERMICLCGLCDRQIRHLGSRALALISSRLHTTYCNECVWSMCKVLKHNQAKTRNLIQQPRMNDKAIRFHMVGQLPLEIIAWLRDVFDLEEQVVTSALTINRLFPVAPSVLGTSWGDSPVGYNWRVTVDNFCPDKTGPVAPWSHKCLLVLNEPRDGALTSVGENHRNCKVAKSGICHP